MNSHDSKQVRDHIDHGVVKDHPRELHVRFRGRRLLRIFLALGIVLALVFSLFIGTIFYLISGPAGNQSVIQTSLISSLENTIGKDYQIELGELDFEFNLPGRLSIASSSVRILRADNQNLVAEIKDIRFGVRLWKTIFGDPSFDSVTIGNGVLHMGEIAKAPEVGIPTHMKPAMTKLGRELSKLSRFAEKGQFQSLKVTDFRIVGPTNSNGSAKPSGQVWPVIVNKLELVADSHGAFSFNGAIKSANSNFSIVADYKKQKDQLASLNIQGEGLNLADWLPSPDKVIGPFGSNGTVGWNAKLSFRPDGSPQQPTISIHTNEHDLRIGKVKTRVRDLVVNLRLIPEKNQIELERSPLVIGKLHAWLIGGVRPADIKNGYGGPIEFEVIAERAFTETIKEGERAIHAGFSTRGFWFPRRARLEISQAFMETKGGRIDGKGSVEFLNKTVAVSGEASSNGISAHAVKQFWPFFLGHRAREWAHKHVIDGWIENAKLVAAIPGGIIGKIPAGKRMKPEHFQLTVKFKDGIFEPLGEVPQVFDANGVLTIIGMQVDVMLDEGTIKGGKFGEAKLTSATFTVEDFADRPAQANAEFSLDGKASVLASIAQSKPMRVMSRLKSSAGELRGTAHADIVVKFPLVRKPKEGEVDWNVLIDLKNGSMTRKISGRNITKANLVIDANREVAWVSGTASIDGVHSKLDIVEPLGKKSNYKRSKKLSATLDEATRKKVGLHLEPIISGPIVLTVEQVAGQKEIQHLDLTQAEINLPWVGWRKGAGIPANVSYLFDLKSGVTKFDDIKVSGDGFGASGKMVFDKTGLRSANMTKVSLNEGDDFSLKISRKNGAYDVNVKGRAYDARGMVNKFIHEGDFDSSQKQKPLNVIIQMDKLTGFNALDVKDASINYSASNGRIDHLSILGSAPGGKTFRVRANRKDTSTAFEFTAENAGHALAFMNVYNRMEGGTLNANLQKTGNGPYRGVVNVRNFILVDEPRLKKLVSASSRETGLRNGEDAVRRLKKVKTSRARFSLIRARIEKGAGYLNASDGLMRGAQIGFTFDGTIFDKNDRTNLRGTFMPAYAISQVVSVIPIIGEIFSNGRDGAFIGITYRLRGKRGSPDIEVNPLSLVTPGIFNKIFEFSK